MKKEEVKHKTKLSLISAISYFLKGNMIFALNGIVFSLIDSVASIFPPLFQQVYTDNIITQKSPEWFTPLMVLYVMLFLIELIVWITFSVLRRKSQVKISISTSANYLWTVLRLPMTRLSQFSPGELAARYTTISKTIRLMDYSAMRLEVTEARLQNVTMTGIGNLETIKALGGERYFFAQWEKTYAQAMNARAATTTNSVYISALPVLVLELTNAVILCLGTWFIMQGEMTPGMLLASQGLFNKTLYPINRSIRSVQTLLRLNSSIQRVKDVTDCNQNATLRLLEDDELPDMAKLTGEMTWRN